MTAYRAEPGAQGIAFVVFGHWLFAVDPKTGRRVWYQRVDTSTFTTGVISRLAIVGDRVVVAVGQQVCCFEIAAGAEVWRSKSPIFVSALIVVEGIVLLGGNGEAAGLDLNTGSLVWHDPYTNLGTGMVTLAGGDVVSGPQPMAKGYA